MTSVCPRCSGRHEIPRIDKENDLYRCGGCFAVMDFGELVMAQPEDEDDE